MKHIKLYGLLSLFLALACSTSTLIPTQQISVAETGTVLFQDDFSDPVSGWDRMLADEGVMDYDAGGYRILVKSSQTNFWSTPQQNFSDVRMEVDTGKLAGPDENRIGLICRFNGSDYYFFIISSDGYYGMGLYSGGQAVLLGQSEMQPSSNIKQGLAVNHLRADCTGNTLTFYANGYQITQTQDFTLTNGDVGILAGTFVTPGVDIVFDNFVVLQP
ncbi:MAG: hypothetical protein FJZ86_02810 [Chloroflexi bacterium]|nr:hypothetical protein [Chloroflexota bacterium]